MENNQKNSNILDDVAKETETEIMSIINEGFEQARKIIEDSENRTKIDINNIDQLLINIPNIDNIKSKSNKSQT